jgi:hypothetical protein
MELRRPLFFLLVLVLTIAAAGCGDGSSVSADPQVPASSTTIGDSPAASSARHPLGPACDELATAYWDAAGEAAAPFEPYSLTAADYNSVQSLMAGLQSFSDPTAEIREQAREAGCGEGLFLAVVAARFDAIPAKSSAARAVVLLMVAGLQPTLIVLTEDGEAAIAWLNAQVDLTTPAASPPVLDGADFNSCDAIVDVTVDYASWVTDSRARSLAVDVAAGLSQSWGVDEATLFGLFDRGAEMGCGRTHVAEQLIERLDEVEAQGGWANLIKLQLLQLTMASLRSYVAEPYVDITVDVADYSTAPRTVTIRVVAANVSDVELRDVRVVVGEGTTVIDDPAMGPGDRAEATLVLDLAEGESWTDRTLTVSATLPNGEIHTRTDQVNYFD